MRTRCFISVFTAVWTSALSAQARVVSLPDTLGANFAIGDSARRTGTPLDYDVVLGVWHFTFQQRNGDGTWGTPFTGHWTFRKRAGARPVIEDQWRRDDASQSFEAGTLTYRAYNPKRKLWEVQGTSTNNEHPWLPGVGWSDSTSRYLVQYYGTGTIIRFRYFALQPNAFLWRADMSEDGGATWLRDFWTMKVTRVGK